MVIAPKEIDCLSGDSWENVVHVHCDTVIPQWERGYRVHGYWLGSIRLGMVGLPLGREAIAKYGYVWRYDRDGEEHIEGRAKTLRAAKREVEREYRRRCGIRASALKSE